MGVGYAGAVPSYSIGGFITKRYQAVFCFITAITLMLINTLYSIFVLHETLSDRSMADVQQADQPDGGVQRRLVSAVSRGLQPLGHFLPRKDMATGRWNLRLSLLGIGLFMYTSFTGYIGETMIIYGTLIFDFGPAEVSFYMPPQWFHTYGAQFPTDRDDSINHPMLPCHCPHLPTPTHYPLCQTPLPPAPRPYRHVLLS